MADPGDKAERCRDCGGPLDAEGYHASEWADCPLASYESPTDEPGIVDSLPQRLARG